MYGATTAAFIPRPRLAKTFQSRHLLAPLYLILSAKIQESRDEATDVVRIVSKQRVDGMYNTHT